VMGLSHCFYEIGGANGCLVVVAPLSNAVFGGSYYHVI
ncbi:hypothetical protein A2U01_0055208, partial [Trifolium medium]|nr:hypothetical protein [Trifolium medium]